jgi:hypothetical protein
MIVPLLLTLVILYIIVRLYGKFYFLKVDNTLMFTGAPGTGKTNAMVVMALKLYRRQTKKVKRHNRFKRDKWEEPVLYSNIPIRLNRSTWSTVLKKEHLLLTERLNHRSVTVITEIGKIASQYDWNNLNVQDNLNDFISLYRQYTLGGYFLCDDQSSDNVAVTIRRRLGTVINMLHFRRFWKVYWVKMRNITVSEDIKTIEDDSAETNMRWKVGLFPLFYSNYDTYAFSERYNSVPRGLLIYFNKYKTNKIMDLPHAITTKNGDHGEKLNKLITND